MSNSIGDQFSIKIEKFVFYLVVIPSIRQKKQSRKKKRIKVTITSPNIEREKIHKAIPYNNRDSPRLDSIRVSKDRVTKSTADRSLRFSCYR